MKIYISGGINGVDDYLGNFSRAERMLKKYGFTVVNPAKVMSELPKDTPRQCYMDLSLTMLAYCDSIYMLRNWQYSDGAKEERDYAISANKCVIYETEGEESLIALNKIFMPTIGGKKNEQ